MRKSLSFSVRVLPPGTPEERQQLAEKAARIHADSILRALDREGCSIENKALILDRLVNLPHRI